MGLVVAPFDNPPPHPMVHEEPAVRRQHRRRAAADLQPLPGLFRTGEKGGFSGNSQRGDIGMRGLQRHIGQPHAVAPLPQAVGNHCATTACGKNAASLLLSRSKSTLPCAPNLTSPRRRQSKKSCETASATRGPSGPYAVYAIT